MIFMDKKYQAQKMVDGILYESNKAMEELTKKLGSKSLRKKIENMPQHPIVRIVDIKDPLKAMEWSQHMEELEEEWYRRERSGRRYRLE
jgi:hypothetical protein